ncbi:hypothetical protein EBS40_04165 [bacterium]|nr:hypothetical protein [bacterium]
MEDSGMNVQCNPHPDAPHGFMRDASHSAGRYVCECEFWEEPKQQPVGYVSGFYTFTICPDDEPPKLFTALTPRLLFAMRNGVVDMTIDQKQLIWPTSRKGVTTINNHKDKLASAIRARGEQ